MAQGAGVGSPQGPSEHEDLRPVATTLVALALAGCGVIGLSLAARRFPVLRRLMGSRRARMRATIAGFMLAYNAISRLQHEPLEDSVASGQPVQEGAP
jgi:hypothetical protein